MGKVKETFQNINVDYKKNLHEVVSWMNTNFTISTCNAKVGLIKLIRINSKHIVTYFCYTTILKFMFQLIINSMEGLMASLKLLTFVFDMSTCKTFQIWFSLIRFGLIFLVTGCKNPLYHLGEKIFWTRFAPLNFFNLN